MTPMVSALAALSISAVTWLWYLWLIPRERVPERPVAHLGAMGVSALLAVAGLIRDPGGATLWLGIPSLMLAGYFFFLIATASLPPGDLAVSVGDLLPSFEAYDDTGSVVRSGDWRGRRVMLKFFRGYW